MAGNLNSAITVAVAGLQAQSEAVSVAAANIANAYTTGYKRVTATQSSGPQNIPAIFLRRDVSQGDILPTGSPTDAAISGNGYFLVRRPDGTIGYTRDGSFATSPTGQLTDQSGNLVLGPIPASLVSAITTLDLANFANDGGLDAALGNILQESQASGQAVTGAPGTGGRGTIVTGALEGSNVDLTTEIVNLLQAKNAYAASVRTIQTADEMEKDLLKIV